MKKIIVALLLLFACVATAHAALPTNWQSPTELVGGSLDEALQQITDTLERSVISIIFALALLQMTVSGIKQMAGGELEKTFWNLGINAVLWPGIALWLLTDAIDPVTPGVSNLGDLLYRIQHFGLSAVEAMNGGIEFSAGAILSIGLQSYGFITLAVGKATATNAVNAVAALFVPGVSFMTILMTFFISLVIMLSCAYLAMKVFIAKIEFAILVALAPINAALMVFGPTREQGWAPFRGAVSLVYRILILGGTVAAIGIVARSLADYVDAQSYGIVADVWTPLLSAAFAFSLLAFVAHKSDTIASSMASGTSNLSSGDLASSVATGVAAGVAGAAAVSAATATASGGTGVKAISDVMKSMNEASPVARGVQSVKSSLGLGGGGDKAPQKPQSQPIGDKPPTRTAGDSGGDTTPSPTPSPSPAPEPTPSPAPADGSGNGTTAGIGGGTDSPQTPAQEKMMAAVGKLMSQGSNLNQKVERDNASTSVNISGHHLD